MIIRKMLLTDTIVISNQLQDNQEAIEFFSDVVYIDFGYFVIVFHFIEDEQRERVHKCLHLRFLESRHLEDETIASHFKFHRSITNRVLARVEFLHFSLENNRQRS